MTRLRTRYPRISNNMLELANYDHALHFLFQHMAVLLTADTKLRRGLFLYGTAKNGKSVYIKLVKSFFYIVMISYLKHLMNLAGVSIRKV
ncbi:hypothetical protein ACVNPX_10425 [Staphylococcus aureus]